MIKEAIEFLMSCNDVAVQEIGDRRFIKQGFTEVVPQSPKSIRFFTLTSLVEFINMAEGRDNHFVHVVSPTEVELIGELTDRQTRKTYAVANPLIDGAFNTGAWMAQDTFVTEAQAFFEDKADRAKLLKIVGTVRAADSVTLEDDGITQKVATAAGVVSTQMEEMPNPVLLHPFETFPEIEQPERKYVCRFRGGEMNEMVTFRLFAVPDPAFSFNTCTAIKEWLEEQLPSNVIVLG